MKAPDLTKPVAVVSQRSEKSHPGLSCNVTIPGRSTLDVLILPNEYPQDFEAFSSNGFLGACRASSIFGAGAWFKAALTLLLCLLVRPISAQTNIGISSTAIQTGVKRLGVNLGGFVSYDSGQILKNLTISNPGFNPTMWHSTVQCGSGSTTKCVDANLYTGWSSGFWPPFATYIQVISGAAVGCTPTLVSYVGGTSGSSGGTYTFSSACAGAIAAGDYMLVEKTITSTMTGYQPVWGYQPVIGGSATLTTQNSDLPPGSTSTQALSMNAPSASDSASISAYFDANSSGRSFVNLNGTFQIAFAAKGLSGSQQVNVSFQRGSTFYLSPTPVTLTTSWANYTVNFTASETGSQPNTAKLTLATVGADSFYIDNITTAQTGTSSANPTVFRDSVVATLQTLKPGIIRMWDGVGLGNTLDNMLVDQFGRSPTNYSAYSLNGAGYYNGITYSIPDFLQLVQTLGNSTEAWITLPITMTPAEASNLIDYLSGGAGTTYGAKRIAAGFASPWTSVIPKIHLEFGNEAWNSTFDGGNMKEANVYGARAQTIFAAMKANSNYDSTHTSLVLGAFFANAGTGQYEQGFCTKNDEIDVAPYMMNTPTDYSSTAAIWLPALAEPQAYYSNTSGVAAENVGNANLSGGYFSVGGVTGAQYGGGMYLNILAEANSTHPVPVSIYEENFATTGGSYTQAQLNSYASTMGAGLATVSEELLGIQNGILNQNVFSLSQYQFQRPDSSLVYLWGTVIDMGGPTNLKRPQFIAQQLANNAINPGATMLQTTQTGTVPTWNQSLLNTVALNGVRTIEAFAFDNGGGKKALILLNNDLATSYPVTFSGANAPPNGTTVLKQVLTSRNISDTNESSAVVQPVNSTLSGFNPATGVTLAPFSMTVLTWPATTSTAATYYVSNSGNDSNDGMSALTAWQTIAKVNAQTFNPGDTVLFQAGGVWREQLNISSPGSSSAQVTFSSYGTGAQPIITAGNLASWTQGTGNPVATSVWYTAQTSNPLFPNFAGTPGVQKTSVAALTAANQWYWDGSSTLYAYSATNPSATVEIPARPYAVYSNAGISNFTLQNLELRAAQSYGFQCYSASSTGCSGLVLNGNTIDLNYSNGGYILTAASGDNSTNGLAQNNIFKNNGSSGFKIGGYWNHWNITANQANNNCLLVSSASSENTFCGGIYVYSASGTDGAGSVISANTAANNGLAAQANSNYGHGIWTDTTTGVTIANNIAYGNESDGIYLEKTVNGIAHHNLGYANGGVTYTGCLTLAAGQGHNSTGNLIYANTCSGGFWDVGLNFEDANGVMSNNTLQNNIFMNSSQPVVYAAQYVNDGTHGSGNVLTNNSLGVAYSNFTCWGSACQSTYSAFEAAYGGVTNSLKIAPGLVDPATGNYNLTANAAARAFGLVNPNFPAPCGNPDLGALPYPSVCPRTPSAAVGQTITVSSNNASTFTLAGAGSCTGCGVAGATSITYTAPASVVPDTIMQGCPVLPNDSVFNTPVSAASFSLNTSASTWLAAGNVSTVPLNFQAAWGINYADSSTPTYSVIPSSGDGISANPVYLTPFSGRTSVKRENGAFTSGAITASDHHTITVNRSTCGFYEYYNELISLTAADFTLTQACKFGGTNCNAGAAIPPYSSVSYAVPTTSTDAAGLPLAPLTWTLADIKAGPRHAVRFTTSKSFVNSTVALWPAVSFNGSNPTGAPLGARFRLKTRANGGPNIASVCTSGAVLNQDCSNMLTALTQYGMLLADIGRSNQVDLASDVSQDPLTRSAIALIQAAAIPLNANTWDIVDESSLQQTAANGYQLPPAPSLASYAVDPANGYVTPDTYAVISGGGTKVSVALQGIGVGLKSNTMAIAAGLSGYQVPSWVTPATVSQSVTWMLVSGVGSITSGGIYTPPASTSGGTLATVQATPAADTNVHVNVYISVLANNSGTYSIDFNSLPAGSTTASPGKIWNNDFGTEAGNPNVNSTADAPTWQHPLGTNLPEYVQYGSYLTSSGGDIRFSAIVPNGNYKIRWMLGTPWGGISYPQGSSPQNFINVPEFFSVNGSIVSHFYDWNWAAGYQYATPADLFIPAKVTNNMLSVAMHTLAPDAAITPASGLAPLYDGLFPNLVATTCSNGCAKGSEAEGLEIIPDATSPHWSIETQQVNNIAAGESIQLYVTDWYTGFNDPLWSIVSDSTGLASINSSTGLLTLRTGTPLSGQPIIVKATDGTYTATATLYTTGSSYPLNSHR